LISVAASVGAGGGVDAAGGHEAFFLRLEELRLPVGALVFGFDGGQGAGDAAAHVGDGLFVALGVLLDEDLAGDASAGWRRRLWRCSGWTRWWSRSWSFSSSVVGLGTDGRIARNEQSCKKIKYL
jgi:hypothetical protein